MSNNDYRLYSFVAGHYLSRFQCGLQAAHLVSSMFRDLTPYVPSNEPFAVFNEWATRYNNIIVLDAANPRGVLDVFHKLCPIAKDLQLPISLFPEHLNALNEAYVVCGIILPRDIYDATPEPDGSFTYITEDGDMVTYAAGSAIAELCMLVKSFNRI